MHACMLSHFSHIQLFATLWSVAGQEPLSMGFSRQEHCSGLPCPPPGGLPDPGIKTSFLTSPALAGGFFVCVLSHFSCVRLFETLWTIAHQAPLSMGFSRQEYWSGLPRPPPGDLPNPGTEPRSPAMQADSLPSEPPGKPQC